MNNNDPYKDFTTRLKLLINKHPHLIITTLSNIFTMRIGNKTHGDLAEIGISEFINQYMYDFRSIHVGKDLIGQNHKRNTSKLSMKLQKPSFQSVLKPTVMVRFNFPPIKTLSCFQN